MNIKSAFFLCLGLVASTMAMNTNAEHARQQTTYYTVEAPSMPSCSQCSKIILGNNFCCNFKRFLNKHDNDYQRAFIDAAQHGYNDYVELLLGLGAEVNGYDDCDGKTGLMYAAQYGQLKTCKLLLQLGAHVDARTNWGSTALMWAAESGYYKICQLLINAGAHVNAHTHNNNRTAYGYAKRNGHSAVCTLLRDAGANSDCQNTELSFTDCVALGLFAYGAYWLFSK